MRPQTVCPNGCILTLVALFCLLPQIACLRILIFTLDAFVWFSSSVRYQMSPHIACLRGCKVTQAAFVWLCFTVLFQMFHWAFCLKGRILTLHLFDFSLLCIINVSSNCLPKRIQNHTGYICLTLLCCVFLNVPSNGVLKKILSHTGYIGLTLTPLCIFKWAFKLPVWENGMLVAIICLFSTVHLEMHPQMAYLRGCTVTLIGFVKIFLRGFLNVSSNG